MRNVKVAATQMSCSGSIEENIEKVQANVRSFGVHISTTDDYTGKLATVAGKLVDGADAFHKGVEDVAISAKGISYAISDIEGSVDRTKTVMEDIVRGLEDLSDGTKNLFEFFKTTGIMSSQLKAMLAAAGIDGAGLESSALEAKNMGEASQQFATLATGLNNLLPSLQLGISDFLTSGVMSDALRQYIQNLGGDAGLFEAYAGLISQLGEGQDIADLIASSTDAQQIVADLMEEAAALSITAEERMQDAVDAFDTAVNNFANALYSFERSSDTGKASGRTPSASDFVSKTDLTRPSGNETEHGFTKNNFSLSVKIDSPVTVSTNGATSREDADVIAAKVNEAMRFNNKGLADRIADSTSRILKSRGDI